MCMWAYVCMRVCACVCMRLSVRVCVRSCVLTLPHGHAQRTQTYFSTSDENIKRHIAISTYLFCACTRSVLGPCVRVYIGTYCAFLPFTFARRKCECPAVSQPVRTFRLSKVSALYRQDPHMSVSKNSIVLLHVAVLYLFRLFVHPFHFFLIKPS